ncbi:MAG: beta-lactamase family protein [Gammaproteobacteria bacterium]|nr:beta-lactamase family protein [Gammaproteobacteria bacterium]
MTKISKKIISLLFLILVVCIFSNHALSREAFIKSKKTVDNSIVTYVLERQNTIDGFAQFEEPEFPGITDILVAIDGGKPPVTGGDFQNPEQGSVSLDYMAAYIDDVLQNQVVGYAYVINQDGRPEKQNAWGYAHTAGDDLLKMSVFTRSFIASVTKQITAVATIKILDQAGIPLDSPVEDYLPNEWTLGFGFWGQNGITFRHLLTHRSGLNQYFNALTDDGKKSWGNDWDSLKFVVENGAMPGAMSSYKNANFALLRILIPQIWVTMGTAPYNEVTEGNHSSMYLAYMYQNIFEPIGIYNVGCWMQYTSQEEALASNKDFVELGDVEHNSLFNSCGGHSGFRMSAMELAQYLAYLRHSSEILSLPQKMVMDQGLLGWNGNSGFYWHGGASFSSYAIPAGNTTGGISYALSNDIKYRKSSYACVMKFPYGVEASLVINSEFKTGFTDSACGVLKKAFELFTY